MKTEVINTIAGESDNLALHVQLCEQRYMQLINKFDAVDHRFERIENVLNEIKNCIDTKETAHTVQYLRWAGGIIGILSTVVIGLVSHLLFK
jgi:tetrahydromethanopterin S-methyltransferase subunit G